jgi:hypothetical protein
MPSRYLLRISPSNGFSEHGNNELLDFIKDGKLLDKVSNNYLLCSMDVAG